MREIKFRAWDKKLKKMFEYELVWSKYVNHEEISFITPIGIGNPNEECIENPSDLMQFTGLFDKNGTPIYEGDIVKYVAGKNYQTTGVVTWADDKNSFNLKTYPLMCAFVIHNEKENKTDKFEWDETDYMEVIGNIYENPTLLESEK